GSTGRPKGAANTHGGIENRLLWMQEQFALGPADRVLHKTPTSFDVSVWELFWPLLAGARLVHARPGEQRDPAALARLIAGRRITVAHFVPSLLRAFLDHGPLEGCTSLRLVVASGEALTPDLVERFHERLACELHNLYGPTEASVDATHWPCRRDDPGASRRPIPIGRPIANLRTYVVDESLRPVPVGVPGELLLGGVGLARGYLRRPALTAERFLPDPFSAVPGSRLYRTGDLARWRGDGVLDFLGRVDDQVKIRGVRVEPAEIEAALTAHPQVRAAAVVAHEFEGLDRRLVAYVVSREGCDGAPTPAALREFVAARLPEVMVPAHFVTLAALPLTPSGKLDRRLLPLPETTHLVGSSPFVPPRPGREEELASLWAGLLGAPRVGSGDDFFELGGHSLVAVRLLSRIRERFGVELPLRAVFAAPTLAAMAGEIERAAAGGIAASDEPGVAAAARQSGGGEVPLSYFQ
ncbi:MAG: non-ribosomal peptide synthetase, partial [Candidatus Eisenbacteria bacterium]